jgi:GxxExxY protein
MLAPRPDINDITSKIIGAAIEVHRALGPGLLESAYQACLAHELEVSGKPFEAGKPLPLRYKGVRLDCGYRLDFIVAGLIVVEVKSVAALAAIHTAQLVTYLKLANCPAGLLINFNVPVLTRGVRRVFRPLS